MWNFLKTSHQEEWPEIDREPPYGSTGSGFFESIRSAWQVDELAAEIGMESQARIALLGLDGVGKRELYNRLQGWMVEFPARSPVSAGELTIERLGLFVLVDLPGGLEKSAEYDEFLAVPERLLSTLGDPQLIVYLLDATQPLNQVDYRWIVALRTCGRPIIITLNKIDLHDSQQLDRAEAERCLAMPVLPISALSGENIETQLLPAILQAAPKLTIALGREMVELRRPAAWQVIKRSAMLAGLLGAQPIPGLELPFLAMLQIGTVLRIGAAYGYQPGGGTSREALVTAGIVVLFQYIAQTVAKLVPFLGSILAGLISSLCTVVLGIIAIAYYEAGASVSLQGFVDRSRARLSGFKLPVWLRKQKDQTPQLEEAPVVENTIEESPDRVQAGRMNGRNADV